MKSLFEHEPWQMTAFKIAFVVFIGLSIVNLYYSIQLNKKSLDKAGTA